MAKRGRVPKAPLTFQGKIQRDMPEFAEECNGLAVAQLEMRIAKYQKELQNSEEHRSNNEALREAQEEAKELGAGYREVRKAVKLKTRYLVELIREKGGV